MTINIKDFDLGELDTGVVLTDTPKASAFQRAGQQLTLNVVGQTIRTISDIKSFGLGEGKAKTASGKGGKISIGTNKFASVVVETHEAWGHDSRIPDVVFGQMPTAHAKAFDAIVAGFAPVPADFVNFHTLAAAPTTEIALGQDASVSMDDALATIADGSASAIVLTTGMLAYLRRQRVTNTGARTFDITGNTSEGTLDGLPYYTITSGEKVGFVGNFADRYFWGIENVLTEPFFIKDAGSISDDAGVEHNLTSENKVALFGEVFQGSGVAGINYFTKIVPAPAA